MPETNAGMPFPMEMEVFRACGIPIYVHFFLLVYFAYDLSNAEIGVRAAAKDHLPDYHKAGLVALGATLGFLALFLSVLIHELGHCAGAKIVGGRVEKILLWPFGGLAFCSSQGSAGGDLVVALAGPATHGPQYLGWKALHLAAVASVERLGACGPILVSVCANAMYLQIALVIFNLLVPVYPLDCSRVIISVCRLCGLPQKVAAMFMCFLSLVCIGLLLASMFSLVKLPLLHIGYSPMQLMIILWLAYQTYQLYRSMQQQEIRHPLFENKEQQGESQPIARDTQSSASEKA
eukprot:gnl/TRDRNA2_/TRDRNA2_185999_c0_seq1.p1 gnl/TRDRNA2_/TRDRNA2_185999_c0~~gnl/TRDRNA2_/TRDRNA2_185999_c0_seq1.p1  ORF type:complete len:292 (-),score=47.79 gnl/TRDRNA2_/TRDRNA2_185999_c0_seq1:35-910(-)